MAADGPFIDRLLGATAWQDNVPLVSADTVFDGIAPRASGEPHRWQKNGGAGSVRGRSWDGSMRLFGARGYGSAIAEAMLALAGERYAFVDVEGFDEPGPARDRLGAVNPLHQVPALVLDDGSILTETAAIALYLSDRCAALAPAAGTPERSRFLRLLVWLVANIYPTFTYGDQPERWTPSAATELRQSTDRYRETLYLWLEGQVGEPFALGELSALDVYLAVLTAWRPGPDWFRMQVPRIAAIAERTRRLPPIAAVMTANGW